MSVFYIFDPFPDNIKNRLLASKKIKAEDWLHCLQEVIELLTHQVQFRDHLTEALQIICNRLDADTALFLETTPDVDTKGQFLFHRLLKIPAIGSATEYDIPTQLIDRTFHNERATSWAEKLSVEQLGVEGENPSIEERLMNNEVSQFILKAVEVKFSSFLLFSLFQEGTLCGFLSFSSSGQVRKSPEAISFTRSCSQILTNLLASQQNESLRLVKQDFLQQKNLAEESKENQLNLSGQEVQPELTSHIASTIPDYIFLVDIEKGKAVFANNDHFLGYDIANEKDPVEIFATIIHPDDQSKAIMEFIFKLKDAKDGEVISSDYRMRHKNGQWVWMTERAKVFSRFPNGVVKQYLAVMQDVTEKKKALIQISESEERYRNFIKYSTEGIFYMNCGKPISIDLSAKEQTDLYYQTAFIQECNAALAKMYGYSTKNELEGQKIKDIHSKSSYSLNKKSFQDFVENNYSVEDVETKEMIEDGSIHHFLNRGLGVIEKGHLIGVWGVQRDITAKREAEEALRESEIKLSSIVEDTNLGLWEWLPKRSVFLLNDNCIQFLGQKNNIVSLNEMVELIHPDDINQMAKMYDEKYDNLQVNFRCLTQENGWKWVQIHGSKVGKPDNNIDQRYSGTAIDIDKQIKTEQLVKENAKLLKAILTTLPDTKLRINYKGEVLAIYASSNQQIDEELVIPYKEGKILEDILPPFVAKGLLFNARKALQSDNIETFEFIESKDKEIQYFEARINSINNEEAIIILRNVTRLKITEKALNDQISKYDREKRQLKKYIDSNLQLENFAYIASHDLREPLRTMRTFGQFLEQKIGESLDKDSKSYLDFIINSAERMNQLIEDLLTYSRVDTDPLTRESIETEKLLVAITDNLRTRIDETEAKIIIKKIPQTIYGSPVRIQQVFQNLIANAIKFHKEDVKPIITIESEETPSHWQFSVRDNGIGIKEEFFDRIFAIFKKLHGNQAYQGTGIGLAIVRRIISQHGGEVWLESQEGIGTVFYFTFLK